MRTHETRDALPMPPTTEGTAADTVAGAAADQWMSYAELAAARGIDRTAALKLALRKRWRKQRDNRGTIRVLVPPEWATPWGGAAHAAVDGAEASVADAAASGAVSRMVSALEAAIATVREQLTQADIRTADAVARACRAEAAIVGERHRADSLRDRADAMQAELATLRTQIDRDSVEAIAVRGQLAAALGAAEEARQQAQAARRDADALLEASDIERDRLRVDLDTMRAALRQAQDAAEALRQAEAARKARGLLARLRAALRRE